MQREELLDTFLSRWPLCAVKHMNLDDYVGLGNRDTFCQWVETNTRDLGSMKGMSSIKFGIYKRSNPTVKPKNYKNDDRYSWLKRYSEKNRDEAFLKIKQDIIKIIEYSEVGKFDLINNISLPDLFKWKVAFLYSNERLIPIYKRDTLFKIARHYGLKTNRKTKLSEIQNLLVNIKPAQLSVYKFMDSLLDQFGDKKVKEDSNSNRRKLQRRRIASKNISDHVRTINRSFVVTQKHNKIQTELYNSLVKEYGEKNVSLEENFVDIKLTQKDYLALYEVKSSSYAGLCVRDALGQLLFYSSYDRDKRPRKHYVVGQYPMTENDKEYIDFLKRNLNLEFDYINIEIG